MSIPNRAENLDGVIGMLGRAGRALQCRDEKNNLTHLAFARNEQIAIFSKFPEVICIDGTHSTNRDKYVLCN